MNRVYGEPVNVQARDDRARAAHLGLAGRGSAGARHDGRGLRTAPGSRHQCLGSAWAMTYPEARPGRRRYRSRRRGRPG